MNVGIYLNACKVWSLHFEPVSAVLFHTFSDEEMVEAEFGRPIKFSSLKSKCEYVVD